MSDKGDMLFQILISALAFGASCGSASALLGEYFRRRAKRLKEAAPLVFPGQNWELREGPEVNIIKLVPHPHSPRTQSAQVLMPDGKKRLIPVDALREEGKLLPRYSPLESQADAFENQLAADGFKHLTARLNESPDE